MRKMSAISQGSETTITITTILSQYHVPKAAGYTDFQTYFNFNDT
jgi:hypothetical protein